MHSMRVPPEQAIVYSTGTFNRTSGNCGGAPTTCAISLTLVTSGPLRIPPSITDAVTSTAPARDSGIRSFFPGPGRGRRKIDGHRDEMIRLN